MFSSQFQHLKWKKNTFRRLNNKPKISDILTYKEAPYKSLQKTEEKKQKEKRGKSKQNVIYLIQFHAGQMEVQISVTPLISKPDGFNSKVCVQNTSTLSPKTQNTHFAKQRTLFWHTKSCNRRGKGAFFFLFSAVHP